MKDDKLINSETSINKSNTLSTSKLSSKLKLNQMQLFAYAILATQRDGLATFDKAAFEKQFNIQGYNSHRIKEDCEELGYLRIKLYDDIEEWEVGTVVFENIRYKRGTVSFIWHKDMLPHITELKSKYTRLDLDITKQFKSGYSWTLYEYLLAKYGYYTLEFTKDEILSFFAVGKIATYQKNTSNFKTTVLDVAIKEINEHTEYTVKYDEIKRGRAITGFKLFFSKGKILKSATQKQTAYIIDLLANLKDEYYFKIIDIQGVQQSDKANQLIFETLKSTRQVDFNKLTHDKADELIKHLNRTIKLLDKMISDDKDNITNKDKYDGFEIPLYDWTND